MRSVDNLALKKNVQHANARSKPVITGFGERFETIPVGGHGLTKGY